MDREYLIVNNDNIEETMTEACSTTLISEIPPPCLMLSGFTPRLYQETILNTCTKDNTLVVLPTGLGKTAIAMLLACHRLTQHPGTKIVILAPTKPLVMQHLQTFHNHLSLQPQEMAIFTGEVSPEKRAALWQASCIIFATPQSLENDLLSNRLNLTDVSLLVVDEAHRAVGDYAYVYLAQQYNTLARFPRILALTASPGATMEHILDVCKNLSIKEIEVRQPQDPDVAPYIQETDISTVHVNLPDELIAIKKHLDNCLATKITEARKLNLLSPGMPSKGELLTLQSELRTRITQGDRDFETLRTISLLAEALKISHAQELLETQGLQGLSHYFHTMDAESTRTTTKAVKNLVRDPQWRNALIKTNQAISHGVIHPKIPACVQIVSRCTARPGQQAIVFTQYRDTGRALVEALTASPGITPVLFVGQAKKGDTGVSQKEQGKILERFRKGEFNTLVATSVAEEGLDIPTVDTVIFYEPIPSAIRCIQRRGRTSRHDKGTVYMLVTKGTRDEIHRWSSHRKEQRMHRILADLKRHLAFHLTSSQEHQETIATSPNHQNSILIHVDHREKGSLVMKALIAGGAKLNLTHLEAGDYSVSPRVAIEYKTKADFVNSIIDKRIFTQAKALKSHAVRPLIIVEGEEDLYSIRNIHPNAINGLLSTLAVNFNIPVLFTRNPLESAATILSLARREEGIGTSHFGGHQLKKPATPKEQQEYILSSLPGVSGAMAKRLLEYFGTPSRVLNATILELQQVERMGEKKAHEIHSLLHEPYPRNDELTPP